MTEQHQIAIFEAMESPDFYPHTVTTIEQRDTHISKVFLTDNYAYKIKKSVSLEFSISPPLKSGGTFVGRKSI